MNFLKTLFLWILSLTLLFVGLSATIPSIPAMFLAILASLFVMPASTEFFHKKTNLSLGIGTKLVLVFTLMIASFIVSDISITAKQNAINEAKLREQEKKQNELKMKAINSIKKEFFSNKESIINSLNQEFEKRNYKLVLSESEKYSITGNPEVIALYKKSKSAVAAIQKEEKTNEILKKLKTLPSSKLEENRDLYTQLTNLHPKNAKYKEKLSFYQEKISTKQKEVAEKLAREEREKAALVEREGKIKAQFSPWDGSHIQLEQTIKNAMDDPSSYEHVETVYWDNGKANSFVVQTTFRGKNPFGALIKTFVKARVNLNGEILEIIDSPSI